MPQHVAYFSLDLSGPIKLLLDGLLSSLGQHFQMQVPAIKHLNKRSGSLSAEHLQLLLLLMNIFTINTQLSWKTGFNLSRCLQLKKKFENVLCSSFITEFHENLFVLTLGIHQLKSKPWSCQGGSSLWMSSRSVIHSTQDEKKWVWQLATAGSMQLAIIRS